jgi:hypothetical protein
MPSTIYGLLHLNIIVQKKESKSKVNAVRGNRENECPMGQKLEDNNNF